MREDGVKKAIRVVVFIAVALLALAGAYRVLSWKDTMGAYLSSVEGLYATEDDRIDVLFVGSSHCYAGVNPDVLWRDYGIASFDMAISGQDRTAAYYYTKEALKTQSPRVVAVDLLAALYDEGVESNTWRSMLSMRTSLNQIDMVRAETADVGKRTDYVLKFPIVHSRYRELDAYDFVVNEYSRYGRGYCYRFTAEPVLHDATIDGVAAMPISKENRQWIEDFSALAEKEGFSLLFLQIPHEPVAEEQAVYRGVLDYLAATGRTVLNMSVLIEGAQLNSGTDFLDAGHLNAYGAEKLSAFLGGILTEEYDLADHRGDPAYALWDESLAYAEHLYLEEALRQTDGAVAYFSRLADVADLTIVLNLSGDYAASEFDLAGALAQIGVRAGFLDSAGCAVIDGGRLAGYLTPERPEALTLDVDSLHTLHVEAASDGALSWVVEFDDERRDTPFDGLSILVYDKRLEKIIGERIF